MSNGGLILTFRDGVSLALNKDEVKAGAVIKFDLDFAQAELEYEEAAWTAVDPGESRGKTVVKFSNKSRHTAEKKRKIDIAEDNRMKSMITAAGGKLISAVPADIQGERRATLTPTQRRNKNRRIHRMLSKLTADQNKEATSTVDAATPKRAAPEHVEERRILKSVVAEAIPEDVVMETIPEEVRNVGIRAGVEPYIPQYVTGPRQFQIVAEHELERVQNVRKQNFEYFQRIQGKYVNILEGLELHTDVFSYYEQVKIVKCVFDLREKGRAGQLKKRTYSEPRKWKRGKGRITIQCGCCYNFAKDSEGNPPGIIRHDEVDPMPILIKRMIERMVSWRVLPADCVPNSCIINIYEEGDCIPPHIDHHDFVRPFCTVSFINQCNIMFGTDLRIVGPGEFRGPVEIPLPVGSVLVLKGNGADIAKHCIPAVPYQRVSITFRRMSDDKVPFRFQPDPELENLQPLEL